MPTFDVRPLTSDDLDQTFGIAALRNPELDRRAWSKRAERLAGEGGMLGLFVGGAMFGFLAFREQERDGAVVLELDPFLTVEVSADAPGRRALFEAAQRVARLRGCASTEVRLPGDGGRAASSPKLKPWLRLGLEPGSLILRKRVDAPP
jgi:hypothetical protein